MIYRIKIILVCIFTVFSMTFSGVVITGERLTDMNITYDDVEFSHCDGLRTACENENYRLLVYDDKALFGLQEKKSGYTWWSFPKQVITDEGDSQIADEELSSTVKVRYGIPKKRSENNYVRSGGDSCNVKVADIQDGIRVFYDFENEGFAFYADYILNENFLEASIITSQIAERNSDNVITEITLLNNFGCADKSEKGFFVIPDGCGAVIDFNNGRTWAEEYRKRIYGDDKALSGDGKYLTDGQIYLPVYAVVRENNALMAVACEGDSNAFLSAKVSGQSGNSYNTCGFTFVIRSTDNYYTSEINSEKLTVFEDGEIDTGNIRVRFYPVVKESPDFTDIASCYRDYLIDECGVKVRNGENYSPLYVELFGGVEKKKSVMGIPVTVRQPLTDYNQAVDILSDLREKGVRDIAVIYKNMTDDGIKNRVNKKIKPSSALGGKKSFGAFKEFIKVNGFEFYPESDSIYFYSGNGFNRFSGAVFRVSGVQTEIPYYNSAYGIPDSMVKSRLLLSPCCFTKVFSALSESCTKSGISGIYSGKTATALYGDYGKNKISRNDAKNILSANFSTIDDTLKDGIVSDGANAYLLPYVSRIVGLPMISGQHDIFNGDIPFYQAVIHGVIPYTSSPFNASADITDFIMTSVVTGSSLMCSIIYENVSILKDTRLDFLYYGNYSTEKISDIYTLINPVIQSVKFSTIVSYNVENSGEIISVTYSDGTVLKADFEHKVIEYDGNKINLEGENF